MKKDKLQALLALLVAALVGGTGSTLLYNRFEAGPQAGLVLDVPAPIVCERPERPAPGWVRDEPTLACATFRNHGLNGRTGWPTEAVLDHRSLLLDSADADREVGWGYRVYDVGGGSVFADVTILARGVREHGFYGNMRSAASFYRFVVYNAPAQAFQIVWRDGSYGGSSPSNPLDPFYRGAEGDETDFDRPPGFDPGTLTFVQCGSIDCGRVDGAGRASWPFAIYNPGQSLLFADCHVYTLGNDYWEDPVKGRTASRGALRVGPGQDWEARTPRCVIDGFNAVVRSSDRDVFEFDAIDVLDVRRALVLDLDQPAGVRISGRVSEWSWQDCSGNYSIHWDLDNDRKVDPGEQVLPPGDYVEMRP